jgi:hypothetical protein
MSHYVQGEQLPKPLPSTRMYRSVRVGKGGAWTVAPAQSTLSGTHLPACMTHTHVYLNLLPSRFSHAAPYLPASL